IERLSKDWDAPINAFFKPMLIVEYIDQHKAHVFECAAHSCHGRSRFVRRYLDTVDAKPTSNSRRHAKLCWGEETVTMADDAHDAKTACEALRHGKKVNGSIMSAFQRVAKGQVTYSHCQHTKLEAQSLGTRSHILKTFFSVLSLYVGLQRVNSPFRS
ncbi:hypothetical protein EI94DRAFT_1593729, partial [Lactarius quietus]